ncbi:MAG: CapA family protein [Clostridiales bacterium]|nr:CapA family protein [Clostridiales bacterium]MCF8023020.1 CapA family protein [Clostridiales bacterium]
MKKLWEIILICLVIFIFLTGCSAVKDTETLKIPEPGPVEKTPRTSEITIAAVGDVMVHSPQYRAAYLGGDKQYDFTSVFKPVKKYIAGADLALANLETTLSGADKKYSGYPRFNSPAQMAAALKKTGFDILITANNHSMDRGEYGVIKTIENIEKTGLDNVGTARSKKERDTLSIKDIKGIKTAVLAYTYGTNGLPLPEGKPYLVNLIEREKMVKDIERARNSGADMVLVYLHFGTQYQRDARESQQNLVDFLFDNGADIVLGSHPHVLQQIKLKDIITEHGNKKKVLAAYSLGNFVSNQRSRYRDSSIILHVTLKKYFEEERTVIKSAGYIPTWVDKSYIDGKLNYRIVNVKDAMHAYEQKKNNKYICKRDYNRLVQVWNETTSHLGSDKCLAGARH